MSDRKASGSKFSGPRTPDLPDHTPVASNSRASTGLNAVCQTTHLDECYKKCVGEERSSIALAVPVAHGVRVIARVVTASGRQGHCEMSREKRFQLRGNGDAGDRSVRGIEERDAFAYRYVARGRPALSFPAPLLKPHTRYHLRAFSQRCSPRQLLQLPCPLPWQPPYLTNTFPYKRFSFPSL
jgi:hypothetical protein